MQHGIRGWLSRQAAAASLVTVMAAAALAYAPSLGGGFLFDDETSIVRNARVWSPGALADGTTLSQAIAGRPVTELTFALDAVRSRLQARGFHETSLILHLAASLLVWVFTRGVFRRAGAPEVAGWSAVAVTAGFALHPMQSQAVAYVSQRAEVLSSLLALATLALLFAADRSARPTRAAWLGATAFATYALAIGSKTIATAVPALFLLACAWFPAGDHLLPDAARPEDDGPRWPRRLALVTPLVVLSAVQLVVFFGGIEGRTDVGFSVPGLDPWRYLLTQARVVPLYLRILLWPSGQNVDHALSPSQGLLDPPTTLAGGLLVLLLLALAAWGLVWSRGVGRDAPAAPAVRVAGFGVSWFFALLAPTSSVVPLADVAMEHRVYLASWGLFAAFAALAGFGARRLAPRPRPAVLAGAAAVLFAALATTLHARATLWGSPIELWRDAAEKSPGRSRPHLNIGSELQQRGDLEGAVSHYRRALTIDPGVEGEVLRQNIASALLGLQRAAEARAVLHRVRSPNPETVVLLASAAIELGELAEAERYAWELVLRAGTYRRSHEAMAWVLTAKGDLPGARESFRRAAELAPGAETLRQLGQAELQLGDREAACRDLTRAAASLDNPWVSRWAAEDAARAGCDPAAGLR